MKKAIVYALYEMRTTGMDMWMVCGTQQEAIDYYKKMTGKPGSIDVQGADEAGHTTIIMDQDSNGGGAFVSQYYVGVSEYGESPAL